MTGRITWDIDSRSRLCKLCRCIMNNVQLFVVCALRFTGSLMYYALSLNAGRLPGDIFLNMFLLAVVEIPANILAVPLLERVGRRLTLGVSTLSAGISSLLMIPFMYINGQLSEPQARDDIMTSVFTYTTSFNCSLEPFTLPDLNLSKRK